MFNISNVTFSYEKKRPVFENFSVRAQEKKIGIIGANGSGKSTILKLLSNDIVAQEGIVTVDTETYLSRYDFQYYKNMSIKDLIDLASTLKSFETKKSREVVSGLRLEGYLNHKLKNLSQGTYKKVGILLSFLSNAEMLLIDEPFESIDQESSQFVKDYLTSEKEYFVLVDHHIDQVNDMVDETLDLNIILNQIT